MKSILLDPKTWDLLKDVSGNIAAADDPYALSQNTSSAVKVVQGEQWFNTTIGIPYFSTIFGKVPNVPLIKALMSTTAKTVPGVFLANTFITSIKGRLTSGQVQVTDTNGTTTPAAF